MPELEAAHPKWGNVIFRHGVNTKALAIGLYITAGVMVAIVVAYVYTTLGEPSAAGLACPGVAALACLAGGAYMSGRGKVEAVFYERGATLDFRGVSREIDYGDVEAF